MQKEYTEINVKLPSNENFKTWSKELVKARLTSAVTIEGLIPFIQENNLYQLNENMLVLYDFHENPISGKYESVILDKKDGIILCRKNSRQLVNHFLKHRLILGAVL